jgi:phospholipase/lecithinase/hemolysin
MEVYFSAVALVHTKGGLKTHLFLNVPPEDRNPSYLTNSTKAAIQKQHVSGFNSALKTAIGKFKQEYSDATVLAYDAHAFFAKILDASTTYGFKNTTGYCTCNDDSYFWYSE